MKSAQHEVIPKRCSLYKQPRSEREAHVGSKYGKFPRVVVVSLDSGGESSNLQQRRNVIEGLVNEKLNPHMKGTTDLLRVVLGDVLASDANPYKHFAMTNSAKCSSSDTSMNKVPWPLFEKCQAFSLHELEILKPDLIVTQGKDAFWSLGDTSEFPLERISAVCTKMDIGGFVEDWLVALTNEYLRVLELNGTAFVTVLKTPHPAARNGQWQLFMRTAIRPLNGLLRMINELE